MRASEDRKAEKFDKYYNKSKYSIKSEVFGKRITMSMDIFDVPFQIKFVNKFKVAI